MVTIYLDYGHDNLVVQAKGSVMDELYMIRVMDASDVCYVRLSIGQQHFDLQPMYGKDEGSLVQRMADQLRLAMRRVVKGTEEGMLQAMRDMADATPEKSNAD